MQKMLFEQGCVNNIFQFNLNLERLRKIIELITAKSIHIDIFHDV